MDDVIISRPFEHDPLILSLWRHYCDATFVITTCILVLVTLMIYVSYRYRRIRLVLTLTFLWGFVRSCFTMCLMFPVTWRHAVFVFITLLMQMNWRVFHPASTCSTSIVLHPTWLQPLHALIVETSFQLEMIKCDFQMMGRGCSLFFFFLGVLQFPMQTHYYDHAHTYSSIN